MHKACSIYLWVAPCLGLVGAPRDSCADQRSFVLINLRTYSVIWKKRDFILIMSFTGVTMWIIEVN